MSLINVEQAVTAAAAGFANTSISVDLTQIPEQFRDTVKATLAEGVKMSDSLKNAFRAFAENIDTQLVASIPTTFTTDEDGNIVRI